MPSLDLPQYGLGFFRNQSSPRGWCSCCCYGCPRAAGICKFSLCHSSCLCPTTFMVPSCSYDYFFFMSTLVQCSSSSSSSCFISSSSPPPVATTITTTATDDTLTWNYYHYLRIQIKEQQEEDRLLKKQNNKPPKKTKAPKVPKVPTSAPVFIPFTFPPRPPAISCPVTKVLNKTLENAFGGSFFDVDLNQNSGKFPVTYNVGPGRLYLDNASGGLLTTDPLATEGSYGVQGSGTRNVTFSGSNLIEVTIFSPSSSYWEVTIGCPFPSMG